MTEPLPTATPEEVGLSRSALDRLSRVLSERTAAGNIPGAVALVARHGKVAYHQALAAWTRRQTNPWAPTRSSASIP